MEYQQKNAQSAGKSLYPRRIMFTSASGSESANIRNGIAVGRAIIIVTTKNKRINQRAGNRPFLRRSVTHESAGQYKRRQIVTLSHNLQENVKYH